MVNAKVDFSLFILLCICLLLLKYMTPAETDNRYNVVLVSIDTLRPDHLGIYGYGRNTSPFIDGFAKNGILFSDALAQASMTVPSHSSILTSKYVFANGGSVENSLTIAEILKENGYATAAFTGGGKMSKFYGFDKGFDSYDDHGKGLGDINTRAIRWLKDNHHLDFFLFIHTYDVHCPYTPPEPYRSMFTDGYEPGFEIEGKFGTYFNHLNLTSDDFRYISALYDGGIRYTDGMLESLFKEFDALGLENNTIIILTADHGESLGEHGYVGHGQLYENQLRVPLIVGIPGYKPAVISEPVQSIDIFPTVLGLLNMDIPGDINGINLVRVINNVSSFDNHRVRLSEGPSSGAIRIDDEWKLIIWNDSRRNQLYNLKSDREERSNVIGANREVADMLEEEYSELTNQTDAVTEWARDYATENDSELMEQLRELGYLT